MSTANLSLPELVEGQQQGEITHNEALAILDVMAQGSVKSRSTAAQPGSPLDGDSYILTASPTGTNWAGNANKFAFFLNGWRFFSPKEGWKFWVKDEDITVVYNGSAWVVDRSVAGSTTQVQYNDAGALAGDSTFVFDKTNKRVAVGTGTPASAALTVKGKASSNDSAIKLDQSDTGQTDEPFIEIAGTSAANTTNNISTNSLGAYSGMFRINVNGTDKWVPFYDTPVVP